MPLTNIITLCISHWSLCLRYRLRDPPSPFSVGLSRLLLLQAPNFLAFAPFSLIKLRSFSVHQRYEVVYKTVCLLGPNSTTWTELGLVYSYILRQGTFQASAF